MLRLLRLAFSSARLRSNKKEGCLVYVGCGEQRRDGFVHCDLRDLDHVDVICPAWELDSHFVNAKQIYSRHMIDRLRFQDVERYLNSAHAALAIGGTLETVVSDFSSSLERWERAVWDHENWTDTDSDVRHGISRLWGGQAEEDGDPPCWDTHKSGYCEDSLRFLVARAGFSRIAVNKEGTELRVTAKKMLEFGERQVVPEACMVRADHRGRYHWAKSVLGTRGRVCDLACGVGYGTLIMAETNSYEEVCGVDLDAEAIAYANEFYGHPRANFQSGDICSEVWGERADAVVSFETIEHLPDPSPFLHRVRSALGPDGLLLCSTPNQETLPFSEKRFPYHIRHYTPDEFRSLLSTHGFTVTSMHSQHDVNSMEVTDDEDGLFLLAVAEPTRTSG